jgi:hypothetical protein
MSKWKVETGGGSNPHLTFQFLQVGATQPAVLLPVLVEEILDGQCSHQLDKKTQLSERKQEKRRMKKLNVLYTSDVT